METKTKTHSLYFVNAWIDGTVIGVFSAMAFLYTRFFHSGERTETIILLGSALVWVINWPHFSATSYRLFQNREHIKRFKLTSFLIPVLMIGIAVLAFASPMEFAPYLVKLYLLWSPYHFSGQTMGITLIYARRANVQIQKWERLALYWFVYGTFLYPSASFDVSLAGAEFYGIRYPGLGLHPLVPVVFMWIMYIAGAAFLALLLKQAIQKKRMMPWILFVPPLAQYLWFVYARDLASFQEFVPLFHSLQYLLIAWSMEMQLKASRETVIPAMYSFLFKKSVVWGVINFIGGSMLFYFIPHGISWFGWSIAFSTGIFIVAVQMHHFFVDGVIWKLKAESNISPLTSNVIQAIRGKAG